MDPAGNAGSVAVIEKPSITLKVKKFELSYTTSSAPSKPEPMIEMFVTWFALAVRGVIEVITGRTHG